jgi:hypothetical protein
VGRASGRPWSIPQSWRTPFAYSNDLASLLTNQLTKFTTYNHHQLAGQVANLDFWISEARHCLDVLDGHRSRFERLKAAEAAYVAAHDTREFQLDDPREYALENSQRIAPLRPRHDQERLQSRQQMCEAAYRFLLRCFRDGLLDESKLRQLCERLNIGVETRDLVRPSGAP